MTRYIDVQVDEEYMNKRGAMIGAEESHDDVFLRITFGDGWDGLTKSVIWENARGTKVMSPITVDMIVDGAYIVPVPSIAKKYAGQVNFSVRGVTTSGLLETSATLTASTYFVVMQSTHGTEDEPVPIDSDAFDELVAKVNLLYPIILTEEEYQALEDAGLVVEGQVYAIPED